VCTPAREGKKSSCGQRPAALATAPSTFVRKRRGGSRRTALARSGNQRRSSFERWRSGTSPGMCMRLMVQQLPKHARLHLLNRELDLEAVGVRLGPNPASVHQAHFVQAPDALQTQA